MACSVAMLLSACGGSNSNAASGDTAGSNKAFVREPYETEKFDEHNDDYSFTGEGGIDFQTKFGKTPMGAIAVLFMTAKQQPVSLKIWRSR